jgi:hypothetical protein
LRVLHAHAPVACWVGGVPMDGRVARSTGCPAARLRSCQAGRHPAEAPCAAGLPQLVCLARRRLPTGHPSWLQQRPVQGPARCPVPGARLRQLTSVSDDASESCPSCCPSAACAALLRGLLLAGLLGLGPGLLLLLSHSCTNGLSSEVCSSGSCLAISCRVA